MSIETEAYFKQMKINETLALKACEKTINKTVLDMYKAIIDRTPVGDPSLWNYPPHADYVPGKLKASWSISFDNVQRDKSGQFTSSSQIVENHGLSLKIENTTTEKTVAISNYQPYAERVELGWSTQAPAGMMRVTVSEYKDYIDANSAKYRV